MKHIAYFSGGKDSTAMLILIKKNELPLDEILYADVGSWMWESVDSHIKEVEDYMDFPVTKLDISHLIQEKFKKYGFPSPLIRWCTGIKRDEMNKYVRKYKKQGLVQYVGMASDELHRTQSKRYKKGVVKFPLIEYGCYQEGFTFNNIYETRKRYNCWCCPLQRLDELRGIFKYYPELWEELREMQWESPKDFRDRDTIFSLEHRFWNELRDKKKKKIWEEI